MSNDQLGLVPERKGQARMMTICEGADVDPSEVGHWYSPAAVREMLAAERERCATVARRWGETHEPAATVNARNAADKIARGIAGPAT